MEANGLLHVPAALLPRKHLPVPIVKEAGGGSDPVLDPVEKKRKISFPSRESNLYRPAHSYTDWTTPANLLYC
jgi:hypothetical protein